MKISRLVAVAACLGGTLAPAAASAHCPLCTAGAGAAAVLAASLGVNTMSIGVFIGAAGMALGLWMSLYLKKQYVPGQRWWIGIGSFALTVFPLLPLFDDYTSVYLSIAGSYGSLLHRTYLVNRFVAGSVLGAGLLLIAPRVSAALTKARSGRQIPYQGMILTGVLLFGMAAIIEFSV